MTEAAKHTSGPWGADVEDIGTIHHRAVIGPKGQLIADCDGDDKMSVTETEANARLIAAAPDLFEACCEFVRKVEAGEAKSTRSYQQMKTALLKTEARPS